MAQKALYTRVLQGLMEKSPVGAMPHQAPADEKQDAPDEVFLDSVELLDSVLLPLPRGLALVSYGGGDSFRAASQLLHTKCRTSHGRFDALQLLAPTLATPLQAAMKGVRENTFESHVAQHLSLSNFP